jgi:arylmalonate decarboxylase
VGADGNCIVGLVVPEAMDVVPAEATAMYPQGSFLARGIALKALSRAGYDEAAGRVEPAARMLASLGAQSIMVIGTSLTFYRGSQFNQNLTERVSAGTGLPASTMSGALVDGLKEVGARRVAVVTAYTDDVNEMLESFLRENGFDVLALRSVSVAKRVGEAGRTSEDEIVRCAVETFGAAGYADGILIVCGGLRTLDVTSMIEKQCAVPVVSSMPAAIRKAVQLAGADGMLPAGYGRLLSGVRHMAR